MTSIGASVGRGGGNRPADVRAVQKLLNANLERLGPARRLPENGVLDAETLRAIEEFQRQIVGMLRPDGRVDPNGRTLSFLNRNAGSRVPTVEPPWIAVARREIGVRELPGRSQNHPRILQYLASLPDLQGRPAAEVDETAWCAAFVNWCLVEAGLSGAQTYRANAMARSWLRYGQTIDSPRYGCIAVVYHRPDTTTTGTTSSGYHVGFCTRTEGNSITLLGGNQSNQVSEKNYRNYWTIQGYRWPDAVRVGG